jgi:hypothetical protein
LDPDLEVQIRKYRSGSAPKCHGSPTMMQTMGNILVRTSVVSKVPTLSASGMSLSLLSAVSQTDMSMASSRLSVLFRLWKLSSALCLDDSLTFLFIIIELRTVRNNLLVSFTYCFCSVPVMRHSCTGRYQVGKMIYYTIFLF